MQACARGAQADEAQELWRAMEKAKVQPNLVAATCALEVCAKSRPRPREDLQPIESGCAQR